jgi:hypothetical protein
LRSLRHSHRNVSTGLAATETRGSVLPQLRHQLSGGHKVLRPLRQTDSLLSQPELSFNLCPGSFSICHGQFHFILETHQPRAADDKRKMGNREWK